MAQKFRSIENKRGEKKVANCLIKPRAICSLHQGRRFAGFNWPMDGP
jgi:hypothetical protein